MFHRKYIFETKSTIFKRRLKNSVFYTFIFSIFFALGSSIFILYSNHHSNRASLVFYSKKPDLMAVFTGDSGRIPFALKLYHDFQFPKLFISGVYAKNTVDSILNYYKDENLDRNLIEIDYQAKNTVGNIVSTLEYLKKNPTLTDILIITHDYHIMRSKYIMDFLTDSEEQSQFINGNVKVNIFFMGIPSDFSQLRTYKVLVFEMVKFLRLAWILTFGDKKSLLSDSVDADNFFH